MLKVSKTSLLGGVHKLQIFELSRGSFRVLNLGNLAPGRSSNWLTVFKREGELSPRNQPWNRILGFCMASYLTISIEFREHTKKKKEERWINKRELITQQINFVASNARRTLASVDFSTSQYSLHIRKNYDSMEKKNIFVWWRQGLFQPHPINCCLAPS